MSGIVFFTGIVVFVAVLIAISKMRSRKGQITLILEATQLTHKDILKGDVKLVLNCASEAEELAVELECVEKIIHTVDGKKKQSSKIVYQDKKILAGRESYSAGHTDLYSFEFDIPNFVETVDLMDYYKPHESVLTSTRERNVPRFGIPDANEFLVSSRHRNQNASLNFPSSELYWSVRVRLKSSGLDLYEKEYLKVQLLHSGVKGLSYQHLY